MSGRTGHLLVNLATKGYTFLELPSDLYATWRRHEVAICHAVLKIGLGLATLCWILDTRTLYYTYAGRQARGKRRKEGAGERPYRHQATKMCSPTEANTEPEENAANLEPLMHHKEGVGRQR